MKLLRRFRMRHLQSFVEVVRAGSVTGAAEALSTVQPNVSRSIREFETALGRKLFHRTPRGLVPNQAGQTLFTYVSSGIHQVELGLEAVLGEASDKRVMVLALPNVVRTVMPGAVRRFKELCPDVQIVIPPTGQVSMPECVRRGDVEFGFGRMHSAQKMHGLTFEHLYSEPLVWFVRSGHPLAAKPSVAIQDLRDYQIVLPIRGTIIREEIDHYLVSMDAVNFPNVIETISFEFARNYLFGGDAVVTAPLGAMRHELEAGKVVALDLGREQLTGSVGITSRSGTELSPSAQLLIEMIRQELQALDLI